MDIWETLNVECYHRAKLKKKEDQPSRESVPREINIQDKIWRLFTNMPTRSGKQDPQLGKKIYTNKARYI